MIRLPRPIVDLLEQLDKSHSEMRRREAVGWTVVCVDDEEGSSVAHCSGFLATEEEALLHAAALDAEDVRLGTTGWRHAIAPIFPAGT